MTSQIYQADDGQLVQDHDQPVPENNMTKPAADLAIADPDGDLAEHDADLAIAEAPLAMAEAPLAMAEASLAEPDADQAEREDSTSHPAEAAALADHESAAVSMSRNPGSAPDGEAAADEPGVADSGPGSPSLVSASFTVAESVTRSRIPGDAASVGGPWNEVQAMFVDDPRASIERAAGLADERVEALIESVRERQRSLQSAWWADDAGTEELRVALQHYRTFWNSLEGLPG